MATGNPLETLYVDTLGNFAAYAAGFPPPRLSPTQKVLLAFVVEKARLSWYQAKELKANPKPGTFRPKNVSFTLNEVLSELYASKLAISRNRAVLTFVDDLEELRKQLRLKAKLVHLTNGVYSLFPTLIVDYDVANVEKIAHGVFQNIEDKDPKIALFQLEKVAMKLTGTYMKDHDEPPFIRAKRREIANLEIDLKLETAKYAYLASEKLDAEKPHVLLQEALDLDVEFGLSRTEEIVTAKHSYETNYG